MTTYARRSQMHQTMIAVYRDSRAQDSEESVRATGARGKTLPATAPLDLACDTSALVQGCMQTALAYEDCQEAAPQSVPIQTIGRLALALLGQTLSVLGVETLAQARQLPADVLERIRRLTGDVSDKDLRRTMVILQRVAPQIMPGQTDRALPYQYGYDGHWITREMAAKLHLVRYFEGVSGPFARLVYTSFQYLAKCGPAYLAWSSHYPVFICDMNRVDHRNAAHLMSRLTHGEFVAVTVPMTPEARRATHEKVLVVEDEQRLFRAVVGDYAAAMLLERRMGGWTLTFPTGGVDAKYLQDQSIPAVARALARCAGRHVTRSARV